MDFSFVLARLALRREGGGAGCYPQPFDYSHFNTKLLVAGGYVPKVSVLHQECTWVVGGKCDVSLLFLTGSIVALAVDSSYLPGGGWF